MSKTIALYGGGFKPPTLGHFEVVKRALAENPEIDEFIIYVGAKERNGITQAESIIIWEVYQTYLPMKVRIEPSKSPIGDIMRFAKENAKDTIYFVIGNRKGNEGDEQDYQRRTKNIETKYPNIKIKLITTSLTDISGTQTRDSLKSSPEEFYKYLPSELTDEEKEEVYNIVKPMVNEALIPSTSEIKSKFKDLIAKVKQQGGDAKKALIMLVKAAKGDINLTNDDKAFIKLQLKDALKAVLGTAIFSLPAGSLVLILLKAIKLHGLVVPTAFLNERLEPYKFKTLFVENENNTTRYTFTTNQGTEYLVDLVNYPKTEVMVEYGAIKDGKKSWINPTNDGEPLKIISTVTEIIKEYYVSNPSLEVVKWEATKGKNNTKADSQRDKLNIKFFQREVPGIKVVHEGQETRIILPKLNENATYSKDIDIIEKCAALTNHMREKGYKIDPLPSIEFVNGDTENARDFFGKTAYYDPNEQKIVLYTEGRHPKDIVRSFAHEMIHHVQNLEDRLGNITTTDTTEDSNLEDIEKEAYLNGNISFRNWTDSLQEKKKKDPFGLNQYARELAQGLEETILVEGRYDAFVNKLSRIVFEAFKDIHDRGDKEGEFEFRVDHPDDEHDIPSEDFYFDLAGTVEITDDEYEVNGGANAGFDKQGNEITPLLSVQFKIPKNPDWQRVSFDIKDVVRHELEHLTQDGDNVKPGKQMDNDQMIRDLIDLDLLPKADYFRLPKEIDSMLQGLYFKAKKSKKPYIDVINDYLDTQPINDEERENILKVWRSRNKALSLPLFEELEEMEYEIYSDMDGVLTDFDASFMKASDGIRPSEYERNMGKDKFWELIDGKGVGYWVGMPWMSDGKQYWDYIKQYNPILLSSPSRSSTSRLGKRLWVRNQLPGTKLILAQAKDKQNYARKNRILIDDRPSNIEEWRSQGGIGILHTSASNTIRQLKELGL